VNGIPSSDALADAEAIPSWESLTAENGPVTSPEETKPRSARKGPASSTKRLGGLPPATLPNRQVSWVVGIVSSIVLFIVLVLALLAWLFGQKPEKNRNEPAVLRVHHLGNDGAHTSISAALRAIAARKGQPARIVLEEDIHEGNVIVTLPNVTIEAEAGKKIVWRPATNARPESKLLFINKAPGFRLKNVTLDGENRIDTLVNLFQYCPGVVLEDLILQGFQKYAVWVTNCEGGESIPQHIVFQRVQFLSTKAEQTDLFFSIEMQAPNTIPVNKFFIVRDCTWGQGAKVKTPDLKTLDRIELPVGVKPEQGK
jgi:hypothetical protein